MTYIIMKQKKTKQTAKIRFAKHLKKNKPHDVNNVPELCKTEH